MLVSRIAVWGLVALFALALPGIAMGKIIRVDKDSIYPVPDGSTWQKAYWDLQAAILVAGSGDEIWVADGAYKPDPIDREISFLLKAEVSVYGGFNGTESSRDQRNVDGNPTMLSGDLLDNDHQPYGKEENSIHVVKAESGWSDSAVLDGFTVTAGYADNVPPGDLNDHGGGILVDGASGVVIQNCRIESNEGDSGGGMAIVDGSTATLQSCHFSDNKAEHAGGALGSISSSPSVYQCTFKDNTAKGEAGGVYVVGNGGNVFLKKCEFSGNKGFLGGAVYVAYEGYLKAVHTEFRTNQAQGGGGVCVTETGSATLIRAKFISNFAAEGGAVAVRSAAGDPTTEFINCSFTGNGASIAGGAAVVGGMQSVAPVAFVNCMFSGNMAENLGGAISSGFLADITLINSTFSRNQAPLGQGGGLLLYSPGPLCVADVDNCIFWENDDLYSSVENAQITSNGADLSVDYSCVQGWTGAMGGVDNNGDDPCFHDADGRDGNTGTEDDNLRLREESPCMDSGSNTALPPDKHDLNNNGDTLQPIPFDIEGMRRRCNGCVDRGAYEITYFLMKPKGY